MSEFVVKVTEMPASEFPEYLDGMNKMMREWTDRAARGECPWVCADCCFTFNDGMPDSCCHGVEQCTAIIQRDKQRAMRQGNEPS